MLTPTCGASGADKNALKSLICIGVHLSDDACELVAILSQVLCCLAVHPQANGCEVAPVHIQPAHPMSLVVGRLQPLERVTIHLPLNRPHFN